MHPPHARNLPQYSSRFNKDPMKRTKRLSIEFWHREVAITVEGPSAYQHTAGSTESACEICGSPWISVAIRGTEEALTRADNLHRALEQAGVHLQVSANGQLNICRKSLEDLKEKH